MTPDVIALVIVAALPYADRLADKHFVDRAASRKHAKDMAALAAKAAGQ